VPITDGPGRGDGDGFGEGRVGRAGIVRFFRHRHGGRGALLEGVDTELEPTADQFDGQ